MNQRATGLRRGAPQMLTAIVGLVLCMALAIAPAADAKRITGTNGADTLVGTKKKDRILARGGGDTLKGRKGKDSLKGGPGIDTLNGGKGKDKFAGGSDNDRLEATDGKRDRRVNGGAGEDTCVIDQVDLNVVSACETLEAQGDAPAGSLALTSASGLACASETPTCTFQLEGTGAEQPVGTVMGGGGATPGVGASVTVSGDDWTAAGTYGCTDDGFLRVTIGTESIDVPITCQTPEP